MNDWMPIETAPKDGSPLLLFSNGATALGYWWHGRQFPGHDFTEFWTSGPAGAGSGYDCGMDQLYHVTHWMPLPPAPTSTGAA